MAPTLLRVASRALPLAPLGRLIELRTQVDIWSPIPLSATTNHTVPAAPCQRCQCQMSVYRHASEVWCWPCQDAEPGMMPMPEPCARGDATGMILTTLLAGAMTTREIHAASGLSTSTTKDALRRLVAAGSVTASPDHVPTYQLAAAAAA